MSDRPDLTDEEIAYLAVPNGPAGQATYMAREIQRRRKQERRVRARGEQMRDFKGDQSGVVDTGNIHRTGAWNAAGQAILAALDADDGGAE